MGALVPDIAKVETAIIDLTNAFRRENRLGEVRANARLTEVARAFAEHLARTETFSHSADGRTPAERVKRSGYAFCLVAENLSLNLDSRGFETRQLATDAVEGWKRSPGHRKNLLTQHVTEIGVGVARSPTKEQYLSVQVFGRPDSHRYSFLIRNQSNATVRYRIDEAAADVRPGYEVRHTVCKPIELEFVEARDRTAAKPLTARFETRDGDAFSLKSLADGTVTVEHERAPTSLSQATTKSR